MKYHISENPEKKKGVVSNLHCFLDRHLDTGFKSKWSGMWSPSYKYLDYYAFKVNGDWLGPETLQATEYGEKMVFHHETDSLRIREIVKAPATTPGIEVELEFENKLENKKAVHVVLEAGVDIRKKSVDIDKTDYDLEIGPNRVTVSRNDKTLMISSEEELSVDGEPYREEHFPGERQEYLIPGHISFKNELEEEDNLKLKFTTSDGTFGELEDINQGLELEGLSRLFNYSLESMRNLIYDKNGMGVIAGHPWFQSYWARDTFWTVLGLIDAGYFELSEDILTRFAKEGLPGKINFESDSKEVKERSDTYPLFIIAADKLERHFRTNDVIKEAREEALNYLEIDQDGVVKHDKDGTWMDTLEREKAVDIQSLWLEAAKIEDIDEKKDLKKGLEKFKDSDYVKDNLDSQDARSINPAVPLMFGHFEKSEGSSFLERINAEFSSRYGARTRSATDPGYNANGYHTGSSWGLTTGWAAAGNLEYGKNTEGKNFLEKMNQFLDRNQLGALPEVVDSETGKSLGCSEQAWSAGLLVHVIDTYLLGIEAKNPNKVKLNPAEGLNCTRTGKKIGENRLDIKVVDGEAEILNDPNMEIIME